MLKTTVIGSFPQPDWLVNKSILRSQRVPRVRQPELWRVDEDLLDEAVADATRVAVAEMVAAGIDVVTDGEIGRESYSNHFLAGLEGVSMVEPATIEDRTGRPVKVPRIVGPIRYTASAELASASFLRSITTNPVKITLPGPFTLAQQCQDEYYGDGEALAFAFAEAVNAEARELAALGVDVVQIDEPWFRNDPESARRYGVSLVDRVFEGVNATSALHMCFGYGFLIPGSKPRAYEFLSELAESSVQQISVEAAQSDLDLAVLADLRGKTIMLGVLDLSSDDIETVDQVADRIRQGLQYVDPEHLIPAPDCGMKYLDRHVARGKLAALAQAASLVSSEL